MVWKHQLTVICLFIGVVTYVMIGAAIFYAVEHPREQADALAAVAVLDEFLATHTCVNTSELATFLQGIQYLTDTGAEIGTTPEPTMWSYTSSVTFALTVVTTIGYGAQTPSPGPMQGFCVCYAMFGIPFCLVLLAKIGDGMAKINKTMVGKLVKWPKEDRKYLLLSIGLSLILGFVLLVLLPCIGFSYIEGWTYGTSLYYTMVTLSTVGFGDYVAAQSVTGVIAVFYRAFVCVWIFIGLAWFSSIISTALELMTKNVNKVTETVVSKIEENRDVHDEKEMTSATKLP